MQQPVITAPLPVAQRNLAAQKKPVARAAPKNNPGRAVKRVVILMLVIGLLAWGAWYLLKGRGTTDPGVPPPPVRQQLTATQGEMGKDFARAERLVQENKWWPPGENAFELYRDLAKQPGGADRAKQGLEKLGLAVAQMVVAKRAAGDPDGAKAVLEQGRTYLQDDAKLREMAQKTAPR
jgi:hypothetical protein